MPYFLQQQLVYWAILDVLGSFHLFLWDLEAKLGIIFFSVKVLNLNQRKKNVPQKWRIRSIPYMEHISFVQFNYTNYVKHYLEEYVKFLLRDWLESMNFNCDSPQYCYLISERASHFCLSLQSRLIHNYSPAGP